VLAALGVLAALYERAGGGTGQHVTASLAATAGFLQLAEMTVFHGRPPSVSGRRDFPGPALSRRLYRASDGWLAVAAATPEQVAALLAVIGRPGADGLDDVFVAAPVEHWLAVLADHDVPACPVIERDQALRDPVLGDTGLTHIVRDPRIGRLQVVRTYADRPGGTRTAAASDWRRRVAAALAQQTS
jgi:crotonobetainyl-CoA:carnitine CoA-transferase CaiB-like acyl-CoA transferase